MQNTADSVAAYILEAPKKRQEALRRLRSLCSECLPGFEESMQSRRDVSYSAGGHIPRRGLYSTR
jgi:hypothetical protein